MPNTPEPAVITVSQLGDESLKRVYLYWQACRGSAVAPSRDDIDPLDIPRQALANIMLAERVEGGTGPRFRYRIVGSAIAEAAGRDPTWEYLDETLDPTNGYREHILHLYALVLAHMQPLYSESIYLSTSTGQPNTRRARRVMMPLCTGERVAHVLSAQTFENTEGVFQKPFLQADTFNPGPIALIEPD